MERAAFIADQHRHGGAEWDRAFPGSKQESTQVGVKEESADGRFVWILFDHNGRITKFGA